MGNFLKKLGFGFLIQPQKVKQSYRYHSIIETSILNDFERIFGNPSFKMKGYRCPAGKNYFAIDFEGGVYRCSGYSKDKSGFMGNILDGTFKIYSTAKICPFETCVDPTPFSTGLFFREQERIN